MNDQEMQDLKRKIKRETFRKVFFYEQQRIGKVSVYKDNLFLIFFRSLFSFVFIVDIQFHLITAIAQNYYSILFYLD